MQTRTVRDALQQIGLREDQIVWGGHEYALDFAAPEIKWCATPGTGALQAVCHGPWLVDFGRHGVSGSRTGIVLDDRAGEVWDVKRNRGDFNGVLMPMRPHPVLRFIVTGP